MDKDEEEKEVEPEDAEMESNEASFYTFKDKHEDVNIDEVEGQIIEKDEV